MSEMNAALTELCAAADELYISESLSHYEMLPDFEYTKKFEKKMSRLCSHMTEGKYKHIPKPFKVLLVAAIITAVVSSTATAVPSTSALAKNYHEDTNMFRTLFEFKEDTNTYGTLYSEYDVPETFKLVKHEQKEGVSETFEYEDSDGNVLMCKSGKIGNSSYMVDTENAIEISEIPLHGTTAYFVHAQDNEFYSLYWALGEYNYRLMALTPTITKEEFIAIAESRKNVYEKKFLGIF